VVGGGEDEGRRTSEKMEECWGGGAYNQRKDRIQKTPFENQRSGTTEIGTGETRSGAKLQPL